MIDFYFKNFRSFIDFKTTLIIKFMLIFLGSANKRAFNKGKRETKQNKRKEARKQVKESGSGPLPDMGALCI